MNHSTSDQSLYIESDDGDDERKHLSDDEDDDGTLSDTSDAYNQNQHHLSKASPYSTAWPKSYRQSIDMFGSVPSPNLGFLANSSMSRRGSSFMSSTLTRRHTPESLPCVTKPLLEDEEAPKHKLSTHSLLPSKPSSSMVVSHDMGISNDSSFGQAVLNGVNVLCGVGILSTPYAVKEGGWLGLIILFAFGILCFYTGLLLRYCLDSHPDVQTYPDIGHAAFGSTGRILVSVILYMELYAMSVEYIILEGDNLSSMFPNASLSIGGFHLDAPRLFALLTTLAVLPTVWLRDLSVLSYISAGGVIASVLVVLCLFWVGLVDDVGIHSKGTPLNLATLPVSVGLYGYCYSGHGVFPNIYTSMAKPSQFSAVLLASFGICTLMYAGVAVMGYSMFGESTESQFTLNLPQDLVASKIALWTTVVNPFTKYPLSRNIQRLFIYLFAMSLEELIPSNYGKSRFYAIAIRSALAISTLLVGLAIPFFGLVMSLIGSFLTMLIFLDTDADTTASLFLEHLKEKSNPYSGDNLYLNYDSRSSMFSHWHIFSPCKDH
ncbi:Amino acid transporter AVT1B [Arabidopsis thaliana]|uniref:Transmembrane amino acid transporter family protein n=1 Tax=Arabidopsis thaliana TaxID=3702 RepID=UPI000034F005|nr:Transmembrane amino acid transporter family protein [Arabidopsis thaliana]NP_191043.2 Transmembrane amino acid transporter family protein [Arabidopsis thaliana]AEE79297.1 Transmembrane amino acid transporter family protein [Arabidopsis thaliana]ANM64194.1 Transmembrane amino acid transporter family protein [Arabidopsis thaliana]|eukprot:NP_001326240.1 Transmembrane amino acid transporter family protein [Arabidopsis thaliana]